MIASVIGTLAGSYRIVDTISVGGMGTVYRAEHTLLGRIAAVKILNPEMSTSRDIVNRFFNEARATTSIKHPGIIEVFDFGYLPSGHAFLVMEFLDGAPLSVRNKARGPIPESEAAAILRGVCSALTAAHAKGIVHRDLKPDNIFIIPDPDSVLGERPKLLDFGIAKLTDIGLAGSATKTGAVMGTPTYMSPEQCRGTGDVDHRADLYSLGCIFYELVTGRPPFVDRGAGELIGAHLFMQPEPPSRHIQGLSAEAEALIMALLSKSPAERPQTAAELAQRLAPIAARGGFGSAASWDGVRPSMGYVVAQPGDATHYPTPGGTPMPTPGGTPMRTPTGAPMRTPTGAPMPTPMRTPTGGPMGAGMPMPTPGGPMGAGMPMPGGPMGAGMSMPTPGGPMGAGMPMPTPMGAGMSGPMPTPMGPGMSGAMPTPMGPGMSGAMPTPMGTPMRTPTGAPATSDPTTLSGAASQVSPAGGSSKRIVAIAGAAVLAGGAALFFAFGRGGGGGDTKAASDPAAAVKPADQGNATDLPTPVEVAKPADTTKPADTSVGTTKPADTTKPTDTTGSVASKPVDTTKPASSVASKPGDTTKPTDTTGSVASKPVDTTKPVGSIASKPAGTTKPTDTTSSKPSDTKTASKSTRPASATKPTKPAATKPTKPTKTDNPLLETDVD